MQESKPATCDTHGIGESLGRGCPFSGHFHMRAAGTKECRLTDLSERGGEPATAVLCLCREGFFP